MKNEEEFDEDEVAFISQKIYKMLKNKGRSRWKNSSKKVLEKRKDKDKSFVLCYECKKPRHFKSECLELEKSSDKKKHYKNKEKNGLMSTWEDLDNTSFNEDEENANLYLMVYTTFEEFESDQEDEVNIDDLECLKKAYHELLSNSSILLKAYKNL